MYLEHGELELKFVQMKSLGSKMTPTLEYHSLYKNVHFSLKFLENLILMNHSTKCIDIGQDACFEQGDSDLYK